MSHSYRTTDRTVIVAADGQREIQRQLTARTGLEKWMDFVAAERGWEHKQYGVGLVEMLGELTDTHDDRVPLGATGTEDEQ
jgi:hypothetical protein